MSWLNPSLLWLAGLVLAPILLHLLLRERVTRVAFPTLRFLADAGRELLVRRRNLENLLLVLRILLVLLLVAAFARPFLGKNPDAAKAGSGREVVVALDVSRSMRLGSRMDDAKREAEKAIAAAPADAAITIATFADAGSAVITPAKDRAEVLAALARAQAGGGGTDAFAALDRIIDSLRGSSGEIHLISDCQASAFPRSREPRRPPEGFVVRVHRVGSGDVPAEGGAAVVGASAPPEVTPGERNLAVSARIANVGPERQAIVKLLVDGAEIDRRPLKLPQDGEAVAALIGSLKKPGEHAGQVVIEGAPITLPGDDRFSFVARVVEKLRVAVIDGHPSADRADDAAFFLAEALDAGADSPFAAEKLEHVGDLAGRELAVLASVDALSADEARQLAAFVERGGGALIALGPGIDGARFSAALGALAPARVRAWSAGERFLVAADPSHPLVAALAGDGKADLGTARFAGAAQLMDSQDAHVVLRFDDGSPALIEARRGAGAVMLFAGALDRRGGDFPLRPLYVPFVREALRQLVAHGDHARVLASGETLDAPAGSTVIDPAGKERAIAAATSVAVSDPGIWKLRVAGAEKLFAVNADAREANLAALPTEEVERLLTPAKRTQLRQTGGRLERVLQGDERAAAERRLNLGWWCLIVLAALVPLELRLSQAASRT